MRQRIDRIACRAVLAGQCHGSYPVLPATEGTIGARSNGKVSPTTTWGRYSMGRTPLFRALRRQWRAAAMPAEGLTRRTFLAGATRAAALTLAAGPVAA